MNTRLQIHKEQFYINNKLIYSEIPTCPPAYHGLLMNARFIQGIFCDKADPSRFHRYGKVFDPEENTRELIKYLPDWYEAGIRAITVGFQGGGPCFTISNQTIENSPFSEDGREIEVSALERMEQVIRNADQLGMVVIVSYFYGAQTRFIKDDDSVVRAVKVASNWLRDQEFTNVMIEIANEQDISSFQCHPILIQEDGVAQLIDLAKRESGGIPVGCSLSGGAYSQVIAEASDVILIHGNAQSRQQFYNLIKKAKAVKPIRPIVCNEDSQAISQLEVAFRMGVSWGYYNNMTKQEPPTYWEITKGEDYFFTIRLREYLGLPIPELSKEEQFYLQGLEPHMTYEGKRWIRLASLYPERIHYVDFYRNEEYVETAYDDPFMVNFKANWIQEPVQGILSNECWKAVIHLHDGTMVEKKVITE